MSISCANFDYIHIYRKNRLTHTSIGAMMYAVCTKSICDKYQAHNAHEYRTHPIPSFLAPIHHVPADERKLFKNFVKRILRFSSSSRERGGDGRSSRSPPGRTLVLVPSSSGFRFGGNRREGAPLSFVLA